MKDIFRTSFKIASVMFITTSIILITVVLAIYLLHNPIKEYLNAGKYFLFSDNLVSISDADKNDIVNLMSKGYVVSGNVLLDKIGNYYSYTITILIFFCTFACVFSVIYIKMNTEERFEQIIDKKINFYFTRDRQFIDEMNRLSNSFASNAVSEELERMKLDEKIDSAKQAFSSHVDTISTQVEILRGAISDLAPQDDGSLDDVENIVEAHHINSVNRG